MNLLKESLDIFSTLADLLALYVFLGTVLGKKLVGKKNNIALYSVYFILSLTATLIFDNPLILLASMFVFAMGVSYFYKGTVFVKLFACLTLIIMAVLSEILAGVALSIFTRQSVEILSTNLVYYIEGILISKALLLIFVKAIQYKKMPVGSRISKTLFFPLLALPLTTMYIIFVMSEYAYSLAQSRSVTVVAVASVLLIVSNILVFFLFEKQLKQDEETRTSTLARQQLQYQTRYYKEIAEKYRLSNKTVHDTKNLLFAISIALENNDIERAKSRINELCSTALGAANLIKSGNEALDALLNTKAQVMEALHIAFKPNVFISAENQIDDIDLCIVIGNALDNAVEACSKISEENVRYINLRMTQVDNLLTVEIVNSSAEEPKRVGGKIITAKKDTALHGFGLQSIEEIVSKYAGSLNVSQTDGVFTLKLYIQNEI